MVASSQMPSADRRAGYRAIILAHMIRKKLAAETGAASFDHLAARASTVGGMGESRRQPYRRGGRAANTLSALCLTTA